ncbi:MAG TPA: TonB-dependent receptor, partial [Thermoanaerobaculia bacterium]|nr:TonB-dependent receptor [Thermoanaerobaculia bacterium]
MPYIHDEIVVRSSELSLLDREPVAPLALSRSDIETLPHLAGDLFRALSLLPGTAANDVTAQFHIHGGRRDEVLILLDGQELYEAYHLQEFDRAISVVEAGSLSGASLSTGAFPAVHGDRMSGVLDMTTSVPSGPLQTRLSLSLITALAASGGSFQGDRGSWMASARRGSIDLASRFLGHEDPAFWDLFGKVGYRFSDRNSLRAHLLHAGDAMDFEDNEGGEQKHFKTDYDTSYLWLTQQATLGNRVLVETTASATRLDRDRFGAEDEEEQSFEIVDRRDMEVLSLGQSWNVQAGHTLKGGFEARRYEAMYDYSSRLEPDFVLITDLAEPRANLTRFTDRFSGDHLGAYVTDQFSPREPLTVELGLRYDRHTLTRDTLVSPRVSLAWRLGENDVVRASWGHFHQSQRPYELQVEDGETRFSPAERSEHRVIGYERVIGPGRLGLRALRIEAYQREIRDPRPRHENIFEPLNAFPESEADRFRISPESSRAEGIELMLRGAAGARTNWWVNYALASTEDQIRGAEVRRQTDQPHTFNLYVDTLLGKNWNLSAAWRYHTGWPTTRVFAETVVGEEGEPELVPVLGKLNAERLPSYHRMDLRASRDWQLRSSRLTFFVDLQNVYNRKNIGGFDLEVDEESIVAEPETWPGFFPSIGISWEL